jgi:signal transduction histidine kinase
MVLGDQNRLQQILVNLASNAIKFTGSGRVQIRLYRPDLNHWAIAVSDTGPGIPTEAQAYIFEPFQQVDGSVTREHVGTGLGLSIVKQLVNLMEGQITLESEVGQGSAFTVLLPLHTVEEKLHD